MMTQARDTSQWLMKEQIIPPLPIETCHFLNLNKQGRMGG